MADLGGIGSESHGRVKTNCRQGGDRNPIEVRVYQCKYSSDLKSLVRSSEWGQRIDDRVTIGRKSNARACVGR